MLDRISSILRRNGTEHVLVVAATFNTSVTALTTDIAKRLTTALRRVSSKREKQITIAPGETRLGWEFLLSDVLPRAYFTNKLRKLQEVAGQSVLGGLHKMSQLRVLLVASDQGPLPDFGNATAPGAYYHPSMHAIVLQVDNATVHLIEHELRHAFDYASKSALSTADRTTDSYKSYGAEYLLNLPEVKARMQVWSKQVTQAIAGLAERCEASKALHLEYGDNALKSGKPDSTWVLDNMRSANEARAYLKNILFSTTRPTESGLADFARAVYAPEIRNSRNFIQVVIDRDTARLIMLTRDAVLDILERDKYADVLGDASKQVTVRALDEITKILRDLYKTLRMQYAGVNLRQIVTKPKHGKGSRTPLKPARESTPKPELW